MRNLKLRVRRIDHKCIDTEGYWDGTWDESYEWVIEDEEGLEVAGMDGYHTREKAREAGEKKLNELRQMGMYGNYVKHMKEIGLVEEQQFTLTTGRIMKITNY